MSPSGVITTDVLIKNTGVFKITGYFKLNGPDLVLNCRK